MAKEKNGPTLRRPLYKLSGGAKFSTEANTGLWYDKFVDCWEGNSWEEAKPKKLDWIKSVAGAVGCPELINELANRVKRLAEQSGGVAFVLTTESRFVTGLGREHPIENGFAWHHTLGTPYLPGSSIKGLIRNWAEQWVGQTKAEINTILGGPDAVGRVLLLDALPTRQPLLEADVMTPHYTAYYQSSGKIVEAPGDWLSPTPIPFLVVAAGTPFEFALIPNSPADIRHLATVEQWLLDALSWLGAGAKTAVGYGRFAENVRKPKAPVIPRAPSKIPEITPEQLKQRLTELSPNQVLLKIEKPTSSGAFQCHLLRLAPKIAYGYQLDRGWTLTDAPTLADGLIVIAELLPETGKRGKFIEVFGRLPTAAPPPRDGRQFRRR